MYLAFCVGFWDLSELLKDLFDSSQFRPQPPLISLKIINLQFFLCKFYKILIPFRISNYTTTSIVLRFFWRGEQNR
jgi:hypothetical protein